MAPYTTTHVFEKRERREIKVVLRIFILQEKLFTRGVLIAGATEFRAFEFKAVALDNKGSFRAYVLRWKGFSFAPDIVEKSDGIETHLENVVHGFLSGVVRWKHVFWDFEYVGPPFAAGKFGLFRNNFRRILFVFEQSNRIANGMADFLVSLNIVEFVPSLSSIVKLSESSSA